MYTNKKPEDRVLDYLERRDSKPLVFSSRVTSFYNLSTKIEALHPPAHADNVGEMIKFVLVETQRRWSLYLKSKSTQCRSEARRSSLDIWRRILFFNPEIDLFSVMRSLASLTGISWYYCDTVRKRVFYPQPDRSNGRQSGNYIRDEYGICILDWKTIGLTK